MNVFRCTRGNYLLCYFKYSHFQVHVTPTVCRKRASEICQHGFQRCLRMASRSAGSSPLLTGNTDFLAVDLPKTTLRSWIIASLQRLTSSSQSRRVSMQRSCSSNFLDIKSLRQCGSRVQFYLSCDSYLWCFWRLIICKQLLRGFSNKYTIARKVVSYFSGETYAQ